LLVLAELTSAHRLGSVTSGTGLPVKRWENGKPCPKDKKKYASHLVSLDFVHLSPLTSPAVTRRKTGGGGGGLRKRDVLQTLHGANASNQNNKVAPVNAQNVGNTDKQVTPVNAQNVGNTDKQVTPVNAQNVGNTDNQVTPVNAQNVGNTDNQVTPVNAQAGQVVDFSQSALSTETGSSSQ
jgi:hypothetical protein